MSTSMKVNNCIFLNEGMDCNLKSGQKTGVVGFNPVALRKTKIVCNFGLSGCNKVKPDSLDSWCSQFHSHLL